MFGPDSTLLAATGERQIWQLLLPDLLQGMAPALIIALLGLAYGARPIVQPLQSLGVKSTVLA